MLKLSLPFLTNRQKIAEGFFSDSHCVVLKQMPIRVNAIAIWKFNSVQIFFNEKRNGKLKIEHNYPFSIRHLLWQAKIDNAISYCMSIPFGRDGDERGMHKAAYSLYFNTCIFSNILTCAHLGLYSVSFNYYNAIEVNSDFMQILLKIIINYN